LAAVTIYFVDPLVDPGVPEISHVELLMDSPVGKVGDVVHELNGSLLEVPPKTKAGVIAVMATPLAIQ
jgi:hypothetical protein